MAQHRSHYWEKIADNWNHVGFPLRPCPRDTEGYSTLLNLDQQSEMTALILGVTPELYHLDWPSGTEVHSCDRSLQMIEAIWPGKRQNAIYGNWLDLKFHERFHCVLCDGGLTLLSHPDGVRELSAVLRNALIPRGKFVTRVFAKTEPHESPGPGELAHADKWVPLRLQMGAARTR